MKRFLSLFAMVLLTFGMIPFGHAAFFEADGKLSLELPYEDDLYAAGGQITLDAAVEGDAFVAGGMVTVRADVSEDLVAAGGVLTVDGNIGDDMRIFGGEVYVNGRVGDDLIITGGTVIVGPTAVIEGDLILSGGRLTSKGDVQGNVQAAAGMLWLEGEVGGDLMIDAEDVFVDAAVSGDAAVIGTIVDLGSNADISGDLRYWTKNGEMEIPSGVVAGSVIYDETARTMKAPRVDHDDLEDAGKALITGWMIFSFFSGLLLLLVLMLLGRGLYADAAKQLQKEPLMDFVIGLAIVVFPPILAFLIMLTVFGIPLGIVSLMLYGILMYCASTIASLVYAQWIVQKKKLKWKAYQEYALAVLVMLGFLILSIIPFIGWLASFILSSMALGAFGLRAKAAWKKI